MKTVYLIRGRYDGGASDRIAVELEQARIAFTPLVLGVDSLPWPMREDRAIGISAVPCVIVDVDGDIEDAEEHRPERPFELERCRQKIARAPGAKPPQPTPAPKPTKVEQLLESVLDRLERLEQKFSL